MRIQDPFWKDWAVEVVDEWDLRLREYKRQDQPAHNASAHTTLYIECKNGKQFAIIVRRPAGDLCNFDCMVSVKIDGRHVRSVVFRRSYGEETTIRRITEKVGGVVYKSELVFSPLNRSEDGPRPSEAVAGKLGTIEVLLQRGDFRAQRETKMPTVLTKEKEVGEIDEKLKKATLTSYVSTSRHRVVAQPRRKYDYTLLEYPQYTAIFNYATRAALELLQVIPGSQLEGTANRGSIQRSQDKPNISPTTGCDDDDDNNDNYIMSLPAPSKRRKVEVFDLTADSDDEGKPTKVTHEQLIGELRNRVTILEQRLTDHIKQEEINSTPR